MREEIVVFLGPTLERTQADKICEALYFPPAEQGSIFTAVKSLRPQAIVLIDGAFASAPSVRHKEILWALSRGTAVYGAASMGALRAAELYPFGMRGWGWIYRWYRLTNFADDDEVAIAMSPPDLGAQPLSEALINMRLTLRSAERNGLIPKSLRKALEEIASTTHFLERTYLNLFEQAHADFPSKWLPSLRSLQSWIDSNAIDQKKADAIGLLQWIAATSPSTRCKPTKQTPSCFILTEAWLNDLETSGFDPQDIVS